MKQLAKGVLAITVMLTAYGRAGELGHFPKDFTTPPMMLGKPAVGKRVRDVLPEYKDTEIHHALYLPTDWQEDGAYPVIVEYAGNQWKTSPGTVEGSNLGYGISGGKGVIWICLPFVDKASGTNALHWWGDVEATVAYCKKAVAMVCRDYGGDSDKVFIAGFSRGAIACNFIGLHDDEIAALWRGFICHSHYDGVRQWGYEGDDPASAAKRLARLGKRPQFISHEKSVDEARDYLTEVGNDGDFTFVALPFSEHTDTWVLHDIPERRLVREWFAKALGNPPSK